MKRGAAAFDLDRAMPYLLAVGIVVIQQVFFGVPLGIFVRGIIIGLLTALIALGMALTYRSNRFVNFAQGDLGTVPVVLMVMLMSAWRWPYAVALAGGIVGSLVLGAVVELAIIRRFFKSPRLLLTVASLGLSQLLAASALLMPKLWGATFPLLGKRLDTPFDMTVTIGGVVFNANDIMAVVVAPIALIALALFLRLSNVGVAIRASADSADRAALLGVPVKRLQTVVWTVSSLLAFIAIFLRAGIVGLPIASALSVGVLLRALGALVLGRMTNLPAIAANAVALGVLEVAVSFKADSPLYLDPILAAIIVGALFLSRRGVERVDEGSVSTWRSTDDVRPIPVELARLPIVRAARYSFLAVSAVALVALPQLLSVDRSLKASALGIYAILGLSVVVLTGWAGQVSLGQIAFFAIGATIGAKATSEWDFDLSLALLLSAAVGAAVAVAVGPRTATPRLLSRGDDACVLTCDHVVLPQPRLLRLDPDATDRSAPAVRAHRHRLTDGHLLRRSRGVGVLHVRSARCARESHGSGHARDARQRTRRAGLRPQRHPRSPHGVRAVGRSGGGRGLLVRTSPTGDRIAAVPAVPELDRVHDGDHRRGDGSDRSSPRGVVHTRQPVVPAHRVAVRGQRHRRARHPADSPGRDRRTALPAA